ncbi:hypothetical protein VB712_19605 [Spirulina sp. CCNP1310]|uniref:hypothetical protein n=1 Tax=Spirulina sp. CCNP1310 TaxID=3110249 RepID=UPI002B1F935B|nr:hypothetical protein [Spirulina sp. CCNP1310]MEA5421436.1 hypothetical protein [Spirulina sp. CCNP1310]
MIEGRKDVGAKNFSPLSGWLNRKYFHHFIAEMVNDFDGDAARFGFVEGAGNVAVETGPSFLIDFGFEGGFKGFIGVVCAEKIGMADKEAFFIVVGIDEPTGDFVGITGSNFARLGMEDIYPEDSDL